jgi:hypothetical protein
MINKNDGGEIFEYVIISTAIGAGGEVGGSHGLGPTDLLMTTMAMLDVVLRGRDWFFLDLHPGRADESVVLFQKVDRIKHLFHPTQDSSIRPLGHH